MKKSCPKCNSKHNKNGNFCSRRCANSRIWTDEQKLKKSISAKNSDKVKKSLLKARIASINSNKNRIYPKIRINMNCLCCNKEFQILPHQKEKRKYCSGTCRNIINNKNIKGSRSKAELLLEKELDKKFPDLEIKYNDREILNGLELDVYFPKLKLGIEWNGIFHYKSTKGSILEKYKIKDKIKRKKCKEMGIKLLTIKDLTSHDKFIKLNIEKIINTVVARQERQ
jgi:endogenous inhibitor of DNA gyrase (YacG/DUF329 family)